MASGQVGRLSVRVLPDTSQFNRDLKKVLERAEKRVRASIDVDLTVTNRTLKELENQLRQISVRVPVSAGLDAEAKRHIKDEIEDIAATVTATADLDMGATSARLRYATRPRFVEIFARINESSLASVASTLAALSGARVLGDLGSRLQDMASNFDRSLPRVAAMTTALTTLSAAALAGTSNLFAIGASLASIVPAAAALPGLFAGFATGAGALVTVMQDMGDVLADLGPRFTTLQDQMSANFWAVAEAPIRSMVDNLFPAFSAGLRDISTDLGGFMSSLSGALSTSLGGGTLATLFEPLGESIRIASDALAPLAQGIVNLGSVGGSYLPQLATWFVEISESFKTWTETADIAGMIDSGVSALQDLGRVLSGTGGILAGFASAAQAAGGASLGALADGLHRVSDAINGPIWQGALTTVFQGAHDAMEALGPGVSALGDAFISLAPTLANIMTMAGQIASVALAGISEAFQQPAFQGGLTAFFEGILAGVQAIAPALPAIGTALGSVATLAGTLASVIGPILGTALQALAPVITMVADAFAQIAPLLGGVLLTAITALAPLVQQLVAAFLPLVTMMVSMLAPILEQMISALLPPFQLVMQAISAVLPTVATMLAMMGTALAQVAAAVLPLVAQLTAQLAPILMQLVTALLPPLMSIFTAIIGILPQLIPLFMMIATTAMQILAAVAPLVMQLVSGLMPIFVQLAQTVLPIVVTALQSIIPPVLLLVTTILGVLLPVIQALLPVVITIFQGIATIITGVMQVIQGIIQVVMGVISGNWSQVWEGIKSILDGVWNIMQGVVQTVINVILGIIEGVLGLISSVWTSMWDTISSFLSDTWNNISTAVSEGINNVLGWFSSLGDDIMGFLSDLPGRLLQMGKDMIQGLIDGIAGMGGAVMDAIGGVVDGAVGWAKGLLGINSPSKVFMEVGEYTGDGLAKGMENRVRAVQRATEHLVPSAVEPDIGSSAVATGGTTFNNYITANDTEAVVQEMWGKVRFRLAAQGMEIGDYA